MTRLLHTALAVGFVGALCGALSACAPSAHPAGMTPVETLTLLGEPVDSGNLPDPREHREDDAEKVYEADPVDVIFAQDFARVTPPPIPLLAKRVPLDALDQVPALGGVIPGVETITWATAASATEIKSAAGKTLLSFDCVNLSSTPVYVGDSTVASTSGVPYCTDSSSCPKGAGWSYDAKGTYMKWTGTLNTCSTNCVRCNLGIVQ